MSEGAPAPAAQDVQAITQQLAAWREDGRWRADPARFRTLEALARRLPMQQEAVRRLLEDRLRAAMDEYAAAASAAPAVSKVHEADDEPPLATLNAYIRMRAERRRGPVLPGEAHDPDELSSARRFRRTWESVQTLEQLERSVARAPANAGPLNSHALVLRSLAAMRDLSPEYLQRFLRHAETLLWLEQARTAVPANPSKKPAAPKKTARRR